MTNRIGTGGVDNRLVQGGSDDSVKRTKDSAGAASSAAAKLVESATTGIRITDFTRLAALEQAISELPDVDEARVARLRDAIAAGTYRVSPNRIAEKLMRFENEFG